MRNNDQQNDTSPEWGIVNENEIENHVIQIKGSSFLNNILHAENGHSPRMQCLLAHQLHRTITIQSSVEPLSRWSRKHIRRFIASSNHLDSPFQMHSIPTAPHIIAHFDASKYEFYTFHGIILWVFGIFSNAVATINDIHSRITSLYYSYYADIYCNWCANYLTWQ